MQHKTALVQVIVANIQHEIERLHDYERTLLELPLTDGRRRQLDFCRIERDRMSKLLATAFETE
ncbi:MAG: hypothetical protein AB2784_19935 [Candidatus Thiodiazotropha endolucinida]